jgi:3-deoxy-manno-octulosonate cytidylyltransferase (CMP-KDO synthetase)
MKIVGIIPSRFASTRFPGKPLADIGGKPMIQRVYEQVKKSKSLSEVIVATDNQRIYDFVISFGGNAMMTNANHQNGTERCAEVAQKHQADYYINIQGDEPFIHPEQIDVLADLLDGTTELGTLIKKLTDQALLDNPNTMKVVFNKQMEALYFSRNCVPFVRDAGKEQWLQKHTFYKHIGIYAYRSDVLQAITKLEMSSLERAENLEQLRWLENGYRIKLAVTEHETIGIDAPEDVERALNYHLK